MRKLSVYLLRFTVKLLPKRIRALLKRNFKLTAWYRKNLANLGFLTQSFEESSEQYKKNIQHQNVQIAAEPYVNSTDLVLVVLCDDVTLDALKLTVGSIEALTVNFARLIFVCSSSTLTECSAQLNSLFDEGKDYSVTTNLQSSLSQLSDSTSAFIIFSGDTVHPECIRVIESRIGTTTSIAYVDTDKRNKKGERVSPQFYPDWNPDLQLTTAYIQSGVWVKNCSEFAKYNNFSLYPAILAEWIISEYLNHRIQNIQHIPLVLVNRQANLDGVFRRAKLSLFNTIRQAAEISFVKYNEVLKLQWHCKEQPLVSLIIPTKNGKKLVQDCIESILCRTSYLNYEILLVDNNSDEQESLAYFAELAQHPKIRVIQYPYPFNYSAINNFAVTQARGEVIGLINNDIEVIETEWLSHMVSHVLRPDIGCVGAKLLYTNGLIQHAGVVMGYGGGAGHAHKYFPSAHDGYMNRLIATQNYSAVTAACLLVKKDDYERVGGLNEKDLSVAFNDVDFCLKVLETGKRNLFCAEAVLYHHESVSRGAEDTPQKIARFEKEVNYLKETWRQYIDHDPAYNPNLTLKSENFGIR